MREADALLAAIRADPEDRTRQLAFADWLGEHDDHERAELVRVTVELKAMGAYPTASARALDGKHWRYMVLRARARDLEARLSAWPCPECAKWHADDSPCPACWDCGDLLRRHGQADEPTSVYLGTEPLPLAWRAGYPVTVTLPRLIDAAVEVTRGDGSSVCFPTPRLAALCRMPPWWIPLEAVMVGDREPEKVGDVWVWHNEGDDVTQPYNLPLPIFMQVSGSFRTPDAAKLALGVRLVEFGGGR